MHETNCMQIIVKISMLEVFSSIPGVPKHMKRFESLITFALTKIYCLLFLLIKILYIEII